MSDLELYLTMKFFGYNYGLRNNNFLCLNFQINWLCQRNTVYLIVSLHHKDNNALLNSFPGYVNGCVKYFFHNSLYNIKFQLTLHVQIQNLSAHVNSIIFLFLILTLFLDPLIFLSMRSLGVLSLCLPSNVYLGTTLRQIGRSIWEKKKFVYSPCTESTYMIFLSMSKTPKEMLDVYKLEKARKYWTN